METDLQFGDWLRAQRRQRDLTQEDLAERASCSVEMIKKIEAGRARPSRQLALILLACLGIPEDEQPLFAHWARGGPAPGISREPQPSRPDGGVVKLPTPLTSFVGRTRELAIAVALLRREDIRLVTFTGPGGSGKTRLALSTATALIDSFPDGVFFVSLAPVRDPALVVPTIAGVLGVRESAKLTPLEALQAYMQGRALLLVIDNFEQVAAPAARLVEILTAAPGVKLLVTSRFALHVPGEREFVVPPLELAVPGELPPLEVVRDTESVRLFCERAQEVKPDFQLTQANAATVVEITRQLDGLPLAIELAAAWIKLLSPTTLLQRLSSRLNLLSRGANTRWALPERQQTLRGAIAWSYDLLDPAEQELFRRLAVFAGGCCLEAAEAIVARDTTLELLAALVDKSLLLVREEPAPEQEDGGPRFFMYETIHEFAAEQLLAHGEDATAREAHLGWCLKLAEMAYADREGPRQAMWLRRLETEHDNLRGALAWCREAGEVARGVQLAGALSWFWHERGHWREGREWVSLLLAMSDKAALVATPDLVDRVPLLEPRIRARALYAAGRFAEGFRDSEAISFFQAAEQLARQAGDKHLMRAVTFHYRRAVWGSRGDFDLVRSLLDAPAPSINPGRDDAGDMYDLMLQGDQAAIMGDLAAAIRLHNQALVLARAAGDTSSISEITMFLGQLAIRHADYALAEASLQEGQCLANQLGNKLAALNAMDALASLADMRGDYEEVTRLAEQMLAVADTVKMKLAMSQALQYLGVAAWRQGDLNRAVVLLQDCLDLREIEGIDKAWARMLLGLVFLELGRDAPAAELFAQAESVYRQLGYRWGISVASSGKGRLAEQQGDYRQATQIYHETLAMRLEVDDPVGIAYNLEYLASVAGKMGQGKRAALLFAAASALREALGSPMPPNQQAYCAGGVSAARTVLANIAWEETWAAGRAMTMEQAVAYALEAE